MLKKASCYIIQASLFEVILLFKKHSQMQSSLLIAFFIPVIIMGSYFAYRQMAPFGQNSILTVDLGQQYIDFLAAFRNLILHHPTSLFYSFSKGLGGEMLGTNAYYLFSPLNLLLLFFPGRSLSSGILILVLLKYGFASLSFCWLIQRWHLQIPPRSWSFATAYALMGWMIANQLNILWLDVLFLLPLVIDGLLRLIDHQSPWHYVAWLTLTILDNYYMAWMVAIFTVLFFIWQTTRQFNNWSHLGKITGRFCTFSLVSGLLSSFVMFPTIYALTQSKGTYTEQKIKWAFEYQPLKILAKLVPGSFNFGQMPSGQPNIYVGMLFIIGACLYFIYSHDHWPDKLTALLISALLVFSFCFQPLDLLWHLGQFPVWYPSRFSFVFCFWVLYLAAMTLQPDLQINWYVAGSLLILICAITTYLWLNKAHFSYINSSQLAIGLCFALISICLLLIDFHRAPKMTDLLFILLVIVDVTSNAVISLNHISYVSQPEFGNYTTAMNQAVHKTKQGDHSWYRIAKNFMRTKDDPFQSDYYGGEHFGSTMEPAVSTFMGTIGQPAGDGFITYSNGTQVTDSLLGFKYFLTARHHGQVNGNQVLPITSTRMDWHRLHDYHHTKLVNIKKNTNALPIAFGASKKILNFHDVTLDPLSYQSQIYQLLAGQSATNRLFNVQNFDHVTFKNVQSAKQITGTTFTRREPLQSASVTLHFTPQTNDSYYLTLGPSVKSVASIKINGRPLDQYPTYHNTIVINVAHQQKGKTISIQFKLKKQALWMQNVSLYQLNSQAFQQSRKTLQGAGLHVTSYRANQIKGTVTLRKQHQFLMTTIPYAKGWHVKVDNHSVTPFKVLGTFMGIPMNSGTHRVTMTYIPPFLVSGTLISLITLIMCYWYQKRRSRRQ